MNRLMAAVHPQWGSPWAATLATGLLTGGLCFVPLFDVLGKSTTHIGGPGAGQVTKVANQVQAARAFERDGIVPDLLTLSKTLGAGLRVAYLRSPTARP